MFFKSFRPYLQHCFVVAILGLMKIRARFRVPRFSGDGLYYMLEGALTRAHFKPFQIEKEENTVKVSSSIRLLGVGAAISIDLFECTGNMISVGVSLDIFGFEFDADVALMTPLGFVAYWGDVIDRVFGAQHTLLFDNGDVTALDEIIADETAEQFLARIRSMKSAYDASPENARLIEAPKPKRRAAAKKPAAKRATGTAATKTTASRRTK